MENHTEIQARFEAMGEPFASGLFEETDRSLFCRYSRALRRFFENYKLPPYGGEPLYPCGKKGQNLMVSPDFSYTLGIRWSDLEEKDPEAAEALRAEIPTFSGQIAREHTVGGNMYTHSYPHFKRIIKEGLDGYEARISAMKDEDLRQGLLDLMAGIRHFHARVLEYLGAVAPESPLLRALEKVPFKPAETLYEALVCLNFVYYLDGCDDIGRPDADLIPYYQGEDMTDVLRCFFKNADANDGWSGALGPDYNPITIQCLKAIKGLRRPLIELRVTPDMPAEVWDAALESVFAGGGSPSFYNEEGYQQALEDFFPEVPKEDRLCFAGGGCTETMFAGLSHVGSIEAGINLALIFEEIMRKKLTEVSDFEGFYAAFMEEYHRVIDMVAEQVNASQKLRAQYRPHPMRTLLVDDCIQKEKDFNQGGARYHWSVINLAGLINVLDSFMVLRRLVLEEGVMTAAAFLEKMDQGENFLRYKYIPRHGMDDGEVNGLAYRLSRDLCAAWEGKTTYLGGRFMPASIQFITYTSAGKKVPATPDGRGDFAPLCDSVGAIHGNDQKGITALLNSAAALCQNKMLGTPVLNVKLDKKQVSKALKPLVMGYFKKGGLQMQVTCIGAEELLAARAEPEKYPNLIVRVGGYSEYFNRLSPDFQQTVIDRTLYGI